VVVSHSRALAEAAVDLSRQMLQGADVAIEVAAGLDGSFGTDAVAILAALEAADRGDGAVVLMDLGSAVLSAELALEMLDDDPRERILLCPAPLVEGLVVAAVAAAGGAPREQVAAEATGALAGKQSHIDGAEPQQEAPDQGAPGGESASFLVRNVHGLHARPAARLVQEAAATGAAVELRNASTGSAWVPAGSLSRVATLGALEGHRVEQRAQGPGAAEALALLVSLAARSFDEPPAELPGPSGGAGLVTPQAAFDRVEAPATAPPVDGSGLSGAGCAGTAHGATGASPGIAVGPARLLAGPLPALPIAPGGDAAHEWAALTAARESCRQEVRCTRAAAVDSVGEQEAALFDAHLLLLDDADLLDDAHRRVDDGAPAATAWAAAVQRVEAAFGAMPNPYLQARAADVTAVGEQVLRVLLGVGAADLSEVDGVLVARDLTPAEAVALDPTRVAGVVLAQGSPTAHSTILVRARGIPAVVGAAEAILGAADGTLVALDGATGELVLDPDDSALGRLRGKAAQQAAAARVAAALSAGAALTRDGVRVLVGANLGSTGDARLAAEQGADLAGLVRTEFLFLGRPDAPKVAEQEAVYRELARELGGRRLTLRTLDVGGDKPLPYLPVPQEANPFLGLRGLRLSLARPELLAEQLRAVVRVAHDTPVSLMFPMVSTVAELLAARRALEAAVDGEGCGRPAGLQVGMMVEVPAAALKTAAFAPYVDFLSIGTNDLTQYAMAAERGNPAVHSLGDPYDPGVLRLVAEVCAGAGPATVAVCGELAADPQAAALLVGLGVRELSVGPRAVPAVKQAVRGLEAAAAGPVAARALAATGPDEVRALLDTQD